MCELGLQSGLDIPENATWNFPNLKLQCSNMKH